MIQTFAAKLEARFGERLGKRFAGTLRARFGGGLGDMS